MILIPALKKNGCVLVKIEKFHVILPEIIIMRIKYNENIH